MDIKRLLKDINLIQEKFPKLYYTSIRDKKFIKGELDICDTKGNYWDSFKIGILIPDNYPFGVPLVWELSEKVPREEDRHISKEGLCCVDIDHQLLFWARSGIQLVEFISKKIYPYFANQLYFDKNGEYANGEYKHNFEGVVQFYRNNIKLDDPRIIVPILNVIIENNLPGRNTLCPCGSERKYKHCHQQELEFLKTVGERRLISDLEGFNKILPLS